MSQIKAFHFNDLMSSLQKINLGDAASNPSVLSHHIHLRAMETKSQEWIEATEQRIREAFDLFDKDRADAIIKEEVGTVMRSLGAYPTERQLVLEVLPEILDDEPTGFVSYQKFERKMLQLLASKEYDPDSGDMLLQAFRTIDTDNTGYISAELLEELFTTRGTPLQPREMEAFLLVARDAETGNIYYEDYVAMLMKNTNQS